MPRQESRAEFERIMYPHLAAAYNLARWLLRHPQDAEDAVQVAYLKAFKAFEQFSGYGLPADTDTDTDTDKSAAWLLTIVRNTCLTCLKKTANSATVIHLDAVKSRADHRDINAALAATGSEPGPEAIVLAHATQQAVRRAVDQLPVEFREVIVLREFEDLSYREIAEITGIPLGTVMSRLARGRERLRHLLAPHLQPEQHNELQ